MPDRTIRHGPITPSWWGNNVPSTGPVATTATWVGGKFTFTAVGRIWGFRCYRQNLDNTAPFLVFWNLSGELLVARSFKDVAFTADGWQQLWIHPTLPVLTTETYFLAILFPRGHYFRNNTALSSPVTRNNITYAAGFQSTSLAVEISTITPNTNANAIDVLFHV